MPLDSSCSTPGSDPPVGCLRITLGGSPSIELWGSGMKSPLSGPRRPRNYYSNVIQNSSSLQFHSENEDWASLILQHFPDLNLHLQKPTLLTSRPTHTFFIVNLHFLSLYILWVGLWVVEILEHHKIAGTYGCSPKVRKLWYLRGFDLSPISVYSNHSPIVFHC